MAKSTKTATSTGRVYYSAQDDAIDLDNLVDHQNKSFQWFVEEGLGELLAEISPVDDYTGTKLSLVFKDYHFEDPKTTEREARENNVSYEAPLKARVELTNKVTGEIKVGSKVTVQYTMTAASVEVKPEKTAKPETPPAAPAKKPK